MGEEQVFALLGCIFSPFLIFVGIMMRKFDFSVMFSHPYGKDDGLYFNRPKLEKIADNTPENRKKYSKLLGNYFIIFSSVFLIVSLYMLLFNVNNESINVRGNSITKYSDARGKYYEETANGYKAVFYDKSEIFAEKIESWESWLSSCEMAEGYYQFIYSDPDSWDMLIYYSPEHGSFGGSSFKFSVEGLVVKVYVTTDTSANVYADYFIIRIQAPFWGMWPNSSELYIDGNKIELWDSQFTT